MNNPAMTILCAAALVAWVMMPAAASAQQSEGQKLRVQSGPATGPKKSFELDLGKLVAQKKKEAQRMAGKTERDLRKKLRSNNRKKTRNQRGSGITADKNFASLNR